MADRVARILCIDGGGIRGLIPATLLQHWKNELGERIASKFHLVAGTSTGGILALGKETFDPNCANDDLDDVSRDNLARLERLERAILDKQKRDLDAVLEALRGAMTRREELGYPTI